MTLELEELVGEIEKKVEGEQLVAVSVSPDVLDLGLDLQEGFFGSERVSVNCRAGLYDVSYFGIFSQAFRTFLGRDYEKQVKDSRILSDFSLQARQIRNGGRVEIYDKSRSDIYSLLVNLKSRDNSFQEVKRAILFFAGVFRDKASNYRDSADLYPDAS